MPREYKQMEPNIITKLEHLSLELHASESCPIALLDGLHDGLYHYKATR